MLELYDQGNLIKNIFRIFGATIKHTHTHTANSRHDQEDLQNVRIKISEEIGMSFRVIYLNH